MLNMFVDLAVPLRTVNSADPDVSDLLVFRDLVGNARVVAIGESAHGAREFYLLKDRLMRYLVSELGFTAFVMESGFVEGLAVNEWVLGGAGELNNIARSGITYAFGECESMRAQLQWMRDWNGTHDRKVRFYGMDVPGSQANPGPAIRACLAGLERAPDDAALLALAELGSQVEAPLRYAAMPTADRERLSAGIELLVQRARAAGDEMSLRCALNIQVLDTLLRARQQKLQHRSGGNPRDMLMADNVRWILEREERIMIGAANVHVVRSYWHGAPVLGSILAPVLGDDLLVVGTTYATGNLLDFHPLDEMHTRFEVLLSKVPLPPDTIDALMDGVGFPLHLVDLRRMSEARVGAATAMRHSPGTKFDISEENAFDALIHVRHITAEPGLLEVWREYTTLANRL